MCWSPYFVKKKSRLDFFSSHLSVPNKSFRRFSPKIWLSKTMIFYTKYKLQHIVIYTFFCQFQYYWNSFFLLVLSYVLKLYPDVIGIDK